MTNYDRIKSMSVEEMAELLADLNNRSCVGCDNCLMKEECEYPYFGCDESALKWLESEAK